jgi:hypothetical protein
MTTARTLIIAAALALAGLFIGVGFARGRSADRYVTVKGVDEQLVRADLAIWPLRLVAADDDLGRAHAKLEEGVPRVRAFLAQNGIDSAKVALQDFGVSGAQANQYGGSVQPGSCYVIRQTVLVRSTEPDRIERTSQRVGALVSSGVVLSSGQEYGGGGPTFVFTQLDTLKPQMIRQATARAREAAEQFTADSRSSLGGIRQASQGVFEILARDQAPGIQEQSQIEETVRVVSTVEYFLKQERRRAMLSRRHIGGVA